MKVQVVIKKLVFICSVFMSTVAISSESDYAKLVDLTYKYEKSLSETQLALASSITHFSLAMAGNIDVDQLTKASVGNVNSVDLYKISHNELATFLKVKGGSLDKNTQTITELKQSLEDNSVELIESVSEAFRLFSENIIVDEYTIYANQDWANTNIKVNEGDLLWVESNGSWKISPSWDSVDAKGYPCSSSNGYAINKEAVLGALIYRVRGSQRVAGHKIEDKGSSVIASSGRLEFGINDSDVRNNTGLLNLNFIIVSGDSVKSFIETVQGLMKE